MNTTNLVAARCHASLQWVADMLIAGTITREQHDNLIRVLWDHNASDLTPEVTELVNQILTPGPPLLHSWDFRGLTPGTLPGNWRCYGKRADALTVSNEKWGQVNGRTGWYRGLEDFRYTDDGIVFPWEPDPRGGLRCGYLTTDYGGPIIPALCRVEFTGRWDAGIRGLWAALGWLCASDGGAGRAEVDVSEYLPAHSLTGVSHVLHGRVAGETRYNFGTRYLGRRSNSYPLPEGVDLGEFHTHWFEARPLTDLGVAGNVRLAWGIDDHEMETFTIEDLRAAGVDWTLPAGWTIDSCTESEGGGGGTLDPSYTGGASMTLQQVRVFDLREAA